MSKQISRPWFGYLDQANPWIVLALTGAYTYAKISLIPYAGFDFNPMGRARHPALPAISGTRGLSFAPQAYLETASAAF